VDILVCAKRVPDTSENEIELKGADIDREVAGLVVLGAAAAV
jgi:hypothetical protein